MPPSCGTWRGTNQCNQAEEPQHKPDDDKPLGHQGMCRNDAEDHGKDDGEAEGQQEEVEWCKGAAEELHGEGLLVACDVLCEGAAPGDGVHRKGRVDPTRCFEGIEIEEWDPTWPSRPRKSE